MSNYPAGYASATEASKAGYYGYYSYSGTGDGSDAKNQPAHMNRFGWTELENMRVNAGILDILKADSFVFRFFYDPNIEVKGDIATWFAKQPNRRVKYNDQIDYRSFKTSQSLKQNLELIEFGCYGDVYSQSFGQLAINEPNRLKEFIELHQKNAMNELNNDILRKFKEDILDCTVQPGSGGSPSTLTPRNINFGAAPHCVIENPEGFYESGATDGKDNAEIVWDSIYTQAIRMCRRSNKYNAAGAYSNIGSLKDIIILMTPKIYSMMKSKLYAGVPHPEEVRLEPIFGGIGVMDFSDHEFSSDKFAEDKEPTNFDEFWAREKQIRESGGHATEYGTWYDSKDDIVMLSTDSYKICDAINPPLFVDTTRIGISMKTYFFKWFFGFAGFIRFVNACKWRHN